MHHTSWLDKKYPDCCVTVSRSIANFSSMIVLATRQAVMHRCLVKFAAAETWACHGCCAFTWRHAQLDNVLRGSADDCRRSSFLSHKLLDVAVQTAQVFHGAREQRPVRFGAVAHYFAALAPPDIVDHKLHVIGGPSALHVLYCEGLRLVSHFPRLERRKMAPGSRAYRPARFRRRVIDHGALRAFPLQAKLLLAHFQPYPLLFGVAHQALLPLARPRVAPSRAGGCRPARTVQRRRRRSRQRSPPEHHHLRTAHRAAAASLRASVRASSFCFAQPRSGDGRAVEEANGAGCRGRPACLDVLVAFALRPVHFGHHACALQQRSVAARLSFAAGRRARPHVHLNLDDLVDGLVVVDRRVVSGCHWLEVRLAGGAADAASCTVLRSSMGNWKVPKDNFATCWRMSALFFVLSQVWNTTKWWRWS